jgi:hypothetical protein
MISLSTHILERLKLSSIDERLRLNDESKISKSNKTLDDFIKKHNLTIDNQKSDEESKVYVVPFKEKIFDVIKKQDKWVDSIKYIKTEFDIDQKDGWRINMCHPKDTTIRFLIERKFTYFDWIRIAEVNIVNNIPWRFQSDPDCIIKYNIVKDELLTKLDVSKNDLKWIEEMFFTWIDWLIEKSK